MNINLVFIYIIISSNKSIVAQSKISALGEGVMNIALFC